MLSATLKPLTFYYTSKFILNEYKKIKYLGNCSICSLDWRIYHSTHVNNNVHFKAGIRQHYGMPFYIHTHLGQFSKSNNYTAARFLEGGRKPGNPEET